jgi:hypothetical protein
MGTAPTLKNDTRGAVMVFGIFAAVFLVGILYYVVGVGDAIVHHEAMQDAADATAYTSAVYHARGMNILAMINLIMAAVLAVLVIMKILQVFVTGVAIIACICAATSLGTALPCDAVCDGAVTFDVDLEEAILNVGPKIECILSGLHVVSNAVALLMPFVGSARSALFASQEYSPTVNWGVALSWSMVPGSAVNSVTKKLEGAALSAAQSKFGKTEPSAPATETPPEEGKTSGSGTTEGGGTSAGAKTCAVLDKFSGIVTQLEKVSSTPRFGLPVKDDFGKLCRAAGQLSGGVFLDNGFFLPGALQNLGIPSAIQFVLSGADKIIGQIVATFPQFFCQTLPSVGTPDLSAPTELSGDAKASCASSPTTHQQPAASSSSQSGTNPPQQTVAHCEQQAKDKINKATAGAQQTKQGTTQALQAASSAAGGAKVVYGPAVLGSDYYAIWSVVHGDWDSNAQRGVPIATWERAQASGNETLTDFSFAEAEFYFDDHGKGEFTFFGGDQNSPQHFPDDAMWNMRWRARLRRMCWPTPRFGALLNGKLKTALSGVVKSLFGANVASSFPVGQAIDYIMNKAQQSTPFQTPGWVPTPIHDHVTDPNGGLVIPENPGAYLKMFDETVKMGVAGPCRGLAVH